MSVRSNVSAILLLMIGLAANANAGDYELSQTAIVIGKADGLAISLLQRLTEKEFKVAFVSNGKYFYDSEEMVRKHAAEVLDCSAASQLQECAALAKYASEGKPLDALIDLASDSGTEVRSIYKLFESARKPRIYIYLSSQALYAVCNDNDDGSKKEHSESDCVLSGDKLASGLTNVHPAEYEAGRRKLEAERELYRLMESEGLSYVAIRAAPLLTTREYLETSSTEKTFSASALAHSNGKRSRFLSWLLLCGVSAHYSQPIKVPEALKDVSWSMLYAEDLGISINAVDLLANIAAEAVISRVYNLASTRVSLKPFVAQLVSALGMNEKVAVSFGNDSRLSSLFYPDFYPPTRVKPLNIVAARTDVYFYPSDWKEAVDKTVAFYVKELASFNMTAPRSVANEPIHVAVDTLVRAEVFDTEQIETFLQRLQKQLEGTPRNEQLPDLGADDDETHEGEHTEL